MTDVKTASGYPAKAIAGYPTDTVIWAVDDHGLAQKPQVVISGVNFGQNLGSAVNVSGTVGGARAAASRGIPALASSAGLAPAGVAGPDYADAVTQVEKWITQHRAALAAGTASSPVLLQGLNVPTCADRLAGRRGLVTVPVDLAATGSQVVTGRLRVHRHRPHQRRAGLRRRVRAAVEPDGDSDLLGSSRA